jgi:large subunit ribosomal protein L15
VRSRLQGPEEAQRIQRRVPKRGFRLPFPIAHVAVNVRDLERFENGAKVDEAALREARLIQGGVERVKVLGDGELTKKLEVHAHLFSKSAVSKIEKAGGKAVVVAKPVPASAS